MVRESSARPLARLFQFSLRQLGVAAVFIAVGSYSLVNAAEFWLRFWLTIYCVAQAASGLLVIYRRDTQRAFFGGYLLIGGCYLLLILSALGFPNIHVAPTIDGALITRFLPQSALEYVYFHLLPLVKDGPAPVPSGMGGQGGGGGGFFSVPDLLGQFLGAGGSGTMPATSAPAAPITGASYYPNFDSFLAVGHCLFGLALAFLGGRLAEAIYLTRPHPEPARE